MIYSIKFYLHLIRGAGPKSNYWKNTTFSAISARPKLGSRPVSEFFIRWKSIILLYSSSSLSDASLKYSFVYVFGWKIFFVTQSSKKNFFRGFGAENYEKFLSMIFLKMSTSTKRLWMIKKNMLKFLQLENLKNSK